MHSPFLPPDAASDTGRQTGRHTHTHTEGSCKVSFKAWKANCTRRHTGPTVSRMVFGV